MFTAAWLAAGWLLVGTIVDDSRSIAILELDGGRQQVVREGDAVGPCTVGPVTRDDITLLCAAGCWRLPLGSPADHAGAVSTPPTAARVFTIPQAQFRELLGDKQKLVSRISFEPVVADGVLRGYLVASIAAGGALAGRGLLPGDLITAVNGAAPQDGALFLQTIEALRDQRSFSIAIQRGIRPLELHYLLD
ncbi:hypothetical protein BH24PSE2_BH24PSE2_17670 [soil metagenome]